MKLISVKVSNKKAKKYDALFQDKTGKSKTISFGATGYRDFTLMSDKKSEFYIKDKKERDKVKDAYQKRHAKDLLTEASKTGMSAGALSYYILWTKPTLKAGIAEFKRTFKHSHAKMKQETHTMPDGTVMTGATHSYDSKPV